MRTSRDGEEEGVMSTDNRGIDFVETVLRKARLRRLLAEAVEEGRLKIIGYDTQGEPLYQGMGQAPPRETP
jgi:hypothetical protein